MGTVLKGRTDVQGSEPRFQPRVELWAVHRMVSAENVGALARNLRGLRSLLSIVIVRQGLLQIVDTLIQTGAVPEKTDIVADQTLPHHAWLTRAVTPAHREEGRETAKQHNR